MPTALSVAPFGALGALTRYGVDLLVERNTSTVFPLSTFAINITGCVFAGAAIGALVDRYHEPA
jgi:fluoride exporter